jgi:GT2 family glycosyltransferase
MATARQPISIVIPAFNQLTYCQQCIASLQANTQREHRLILVDNGSTDGVAEFFDVVPGAVVVHTGKNLGFSGGINRGLEKASGHVVLLNSDTILPPDWLARLEAALLTSEDWGIIGPMTNCAAGPQQINGLYFDAEATIYNFAEQRAAAFGDSVRETNRLIGFCMLIREEALEKVGTLDERFEIGNFEDDDYCKRVRAAGYRLGMAEGSFVFHYGGRTFAGMGLDGERYHEVLEANRVRYEEKWGIKLPTNVSPQRLAHHLNECAREALAAGNPTEAVRMLRAAVHAAPEEARHYNDLGFALWQDGKQEQALQCFLAALEQDPTNPDARANATDAAQALGKTVELPEA